MSQSTLLQLVKVGLLYWRIDLRRSSYFRILTAYFRICNNYINTDFSKLKAAKWDFSGHWWFDRNCFGSKMKSKMNFSIDICFLIFNMMNFWRDLSIDFTYSIWHLKFWNFETLSWNAPNQLAQILKSLKTTAIYWWTSLPIITLSVTQLGEIYRL